MLILAFYCKSKEKIYSGTEEELITGTMCCWDVIGWKAETVVNASFWATGFGRATASVHDFVSIRVGPGRVCVWFWLTALALSSLRFFPLPTPVTTAFAQIQVISINLLYFCLSNSFMPSPSLRLWQVVLLFINSLLHLYLNNQWLDIQVLKNFLSILIKILIWVDVEK